VLVAGVLASVRHLKEARVEREGQQAAAAMLKQMFREAGLPVMDSTTHIVPLMVGDPVRAKKISDILLAEYGVYVQPINFPTVPRGTERLRFTPGPAHTEAMMRELTGRAGRDLGPAGAGSPRYWLAIGSSATSPPRPAPKPLKPVFIAAP
jgi:5-aminolevulinate synthase